MCDSKHYHLCRWEVLARPKHLGGWGLHNIYSFNKALTVLTLWRVLTKKGLWKKILKEKYFPHLSVSSWLKSVNLNYSSASKIWTSLVKVVPLLTS
jgi:hypothetical protein